MASLDSCAATIGLFEIKVRQKAQLLNVYAEEAADYIFSLDKPVERIIISHAHPDHWAGLEVLTARFPGSPVYALAEVAHAIEKLGPAMLSGLRKLVGASVAELTVTPTYILQPGVITIDSIDFDLRLMRDAESDFQLLALMPLQKLVLAFDLVFSVNNHLFTIAPNFDAWTDILLDLKRLEGYDRILIGHNEPTGIASIDATIDYLYAAKLAYASSTDGVEYADKLKSTFPQRKQSAWVDFSGRRLYATR